MRDLHSYYLLVLTTLMFTNLFLHARLLMLSINCIVLHLGVIFDSELLCNTAKKRLILLIHIEELLREISYI